MAEGEDATGNGWPLPTIVAIATAVVAVVVAVAVRSSSKPKLNLPPGPKGLPVIGTLFQTRGPKTHRILSELAKEYGSLFTLRTGLKYFIVVTSAEITYEALVKDAATFSSRPKLKSRLNYTGWRSVNSALSGNYWRGIRKNLVSHVLSTKQVASFAPFREEELDTLIERVRAQAAEKDGIVKVLPHCRFTVFSILLHVCFGKRFEPAVIEEIDEILKRLLVILAPQVIDFLPFLQPFSKHHKECQQLLGRVRKIFGPLILQHRDLIAAGRSSGDYVDSLIALQKTSPDLQLVETDILGLIGEVLTGGTDTTADTLEWTMANLVQTPEIQTRLYEEIRSVAGDRPVNESDLDKLPYLQATVKEALRKHPALPFAITHGLSQPGKLRGYDIPEDAMVLFHVQAIQNDPEFWDKPDEFRPDRFLERNPNYDMTASHGVDSFHLLPFGAGRRICPGMSLGLKHAHLILGRLIQTFEWTTVTPGQAVDFEEHLEFTIVMTNPLEARVKERTA